MQQADPSRSQVLRQVRPGSATAQGESDGRATIADIARLTGVSVATVSKVLNDRTDVAASTRALVQAALVEHRYVKPPRAKVNRRKRQRSDLIEILLNDAGSPWGAELIRGVEAEARPAQVGVVVATHEPGVDDTSAWLRQVEKRGSLGAILALSDLPSADHRRLVGAGLPMVLVEQVGDFESDLPAFGAGNWRGGLIATAHLIELGHRRIGTVTGPMRYLCSQARLAGYRAALERSGLPSDPALVAHGDFHYDAGKSAALALLERDEPPTAIFAGNDEQALGVYAAAQQRSLRVPEDLSIIGFDDVPMSQWVLPALTTVHQPIRELGQLATRAVLAAAAGEAPLPQGRTELPTTLVVRGSTAPPGRLSRG
ncbi:LacI family DNA-binding transcriptional regulator [Dactylosporangium sp. CA-092794]|uniref:LacI family DNA-binding transcriptional regulator n=1 Tax=Dactylosporangium sp. CA-092794 TaxID=3239929 RepID=UPI003D93611E